MSVCFFYPKVIPNSVAPWWVTFLTFLTQSILFSPQGLRVPHSGRSAYRSVTFSYRFTANGQCLVALDRAFILALFSLFVRREHFIELSHRFLTPLTNAYQNYSVLDNTRAISLALFSSLLFSFCQPSIISSKFYQIYSYAGHLLNGLTLRTLVNESKIGSVLGPF